MKATSTCNRTIIENTDNCQVNLLQRVHECNLVPMSDCASMSQNVTKSHNHNTCLYLFIREYCSRMHCTEMDNEDTVLI